MRIAQYQLGDVYFISYFDSVHVISRLVVATYFNRIRKAAGSTSGIWIFRFDLCEITIKHSIEDRATNCQNILENKEREKPQ